MQATLNGKYLPEYSNAKKIVEFVLKTMPNSRNNDKMLIREVIIFCLENDMKVPAYETITRARRKLNEDGLFLPNDNIAAGRKEKERFFSSGARSGLL